MDNPNINIVQNLISGDQKTFEKIFFLNFGKLFRYSKEYVIDSEVAREIVQDAFAKLWELRKQLNENSNITAYLFTLVRNSSLNYLRQMIARQKYAEYSKYKYNQYILNYSALEDETSRNLIYKELEETIMNAIEELPPKCKTVFKLSRFQDLHYKEISERLNISVKTVENHISEALRRIHIKVQQYI